MTPLTPTLRTGDTVTIPTGGGHVKCGRILRLGGHMQPDAADCFVIQLFSGQIARPTTRTLRYCDEGLRWLRGRHAENSEQAQALCAAQALVGVSPWKERVGWSGS